MKGIGTFLDERVVSRERVPAVLPRALVLSAEHIGMSNQPFCVLHRTVQSAADLKLSTYQRSLGGMKLGRYVHRQIESLTKATRLERALLCETAMTRNPATLKRLIQVRARRRVHLHPITRLVLACLNGLGLKIVDSEVIVHRPGHRRYATSIDLLCQHIKRGTRVIIELKTGHRDPATYLAPVHFLRSSRPALVSTFGRHLFQLFSTCLLFNLQFPTHTVFPAYLIHVPTHTDAYVYTLPPNVLARRTALITALST